MHSSHMHPGPSGTRRTVGEVSLPHLVDSCCLFPKLIRSLDDHKGRAGDEVMRLEQAIHRGFGHEVLLRIGEPHSQLPR